MHSGHYVHSQCGRGLALGLLGLVGVIDDSLATARVAVWLSSGRAHGVGSRGTPVPPILCCFSCTTHDPSTLDRPTPVRSLLCSPIHHHPPPSTHRPSTVATVHIASQVRTAPHGTALSSHAPHRFAVGGASPTVSSSTATPPPCFDAGRSTRTHPGHSSHRSC